MSGSKKSSPTRPVFSLGRNGRLVHASGECIERHRHTPSFIAIVLRGTYIEAGDSGFAELRPGDVAVHGPCEAHINRVGVNGAEVLLLPSASNVGLKGRVLDVDEIVRVAERDPALAVQLTERNLTVRPTASADWPQMLAQELMARPDLTITNWASAHGLRPETVSRGFNQMFGCTPKTFRASVRAQRAWREIKDSVRPLKDIAAELGFSDQGHMSRDVLLLTGRSPREWRRLTPAPVS